jgi:hypothetical protein
MVSLILLFASATPGDAAPAASGDIEAKAVAARRNIRDIHLRLRITSGGLRKGAWKQRTRSYEIWWDKAHERSDSTLEGEKDKKNSIGYRQVECLNCERNDHIVRFIESVTPVELMAPKHPNYKVAFTESFDPRLIGYSMLPHTELIGHRRQDHQIETDIDSPAIGPRRVEEGTLRGEAAIALRSKRKKPEADYTVWVLPRKGYGVGRIDFERRTDKGKMGLIRQDSELELDGVSGLWFPKRCVWEEQLDGEVTDREVIEISLAELNRGIDPAIFTMAEMNIPNGATVMLPEKKKGRLVWWNGKPIPPSEIPAEKAPAEEVVVAQPANADAMTGISLRWWYVAAAIGFSCCAVFLLRWAMIRSRG